MGDFSGFPKDMLQFLRDLSNNNNREWFNENKERYRESIVAPMSGFISAMGDRLEGISESFIADPRPNGGSMFRIYRDIRFSKDKTPYKENVGCQFRHIAGKDAHAPGFYIHIEPKEVFSGGGVWNPPNAVLDKIRTAILQHTDRWSEIIAAIEKNPEFSGILGDSLKRPPRGYDPDHPFITDLKRKSLFLMYTIKPALLTEPNLIERIERSFRDSAPLMAFVTDALDLPF